MFKHALPFLLCLAACPAATARHQGSGQGLAQQIDVHLEEEAPGAAAGDGNALRRSSLAGRIQRTSVDLADAVASQHSLRSRILGMRGAHGLAPVPDTVAARSGASLNAVLAEGSTVPLAQEIRQLLPGVAAGGHTARRALARLVALSARPGAKAAMITAGLVSATETLLKRPSTDATTQGLSGSLLAFLTDLPGTSAFPT